MSSATAIPLEMPTTAAASAPNTANGAGFRPNALFAQLFASLSAGAAAPSPPFNAGAGAAPTGGNPLPPAGNPLPLAALHPSMVDARANAAPPQRVHALIEQILAAQASENAVPMAEIAVADGPVPPAPGGNGIMLAGGVPQAVSAIALPVVATNARGNAAVPADDTAAPLPPSASDRPAGAPSAPTVAIAANLAVAAAGRAAHAPVMTAAGDMPPLTTHGTGAAETPRPAVSADGRAEAILGKLIAMGGPQQAAHSALPAQAINQVAQSATHAGLPPGLTTALAALDGVDTAAQRLDLQLPLDGRPTASANQSLPQWSPDQLSSERWARALGDRVIWMINAGSHKATIQLHPAELGQIELRVSVANHSANVEVTASQANTRDLIETMAPRLVASLESSGIKLDDLKVQSDDAGKAAARDGAGSERQSESKQGNPDADSGTDNGRSQRAAHADGEALNNGDDPPGAVSLLNLTGIDTYA